MSRPLLVLLTGPNLHLLGKREPAVYGSATLDDLAALATATAGERGFDLVHHQSNSERELVDAVHRYRESAAGLIINGGALTHYGWALADALAMFPAPIVELHITNPAAREPWRHASVISPQAKAQIVGFGGVGYRLAVEGIVSLIES